MRYIENITDKEKQDTNVLTEDNNEFLLHLRYEPIHACWYFSINYFDTKTNENFIIENRRLVKHENILLPYFYMFPFGLYISSAEERDPMYKGDFIDATFKIFSLSKQDVLGHKETLNI